MKKIIIVLLLISLVSTLLTGCIQWETAEKYELLQDTSNIKSIRIYSENTDSEILYNYSDPTEPCGELLGEIPSGQYDAFVEELLGLSYVDHHIIFLVPAAYDPNFYYLSPIVKIEYYDGSCELISSAIQRQFNVNEEYPDVTDYDVDDDAWNTFLGKWAALSE